MLDAHSLTPQDLQGLSAEASKRVHQMLVHLHERVAQQEREIKHKDARHEKIMFELARLKRWKFSAKAEHMNPEQRRLFEEAMAEDEAALLLALRARFPEAFKA